MPSFRIVILTALAMFAFASNSLLARGALKHTRIDAGSFITLRLLSGSLLLSLVIRWKRPSQEPGRGNWLSALALYAYAACFSYAYISLSSGTGALIAIGAVQAAMISHGLAKGELLRAWQLVGLALSFAGLIYLLLPGLSAPPLVGSLLMLGAGLSWGVYSVRGRGQVDPLGVTAGNFLRAAPVAAGVSFLTRRHASIDPAGLGYALVSGAITSGLGYVCWYSVLPALQTTSAAIVQLSVPVLATLGGILLLGEPLTPRLIVAAVAILGGIALVVGKK